MFFNKFCKWNQPLCVKKKTCYILGKGFQILHIYNNEAVSYKFGKTPVGNIVMCVMILLRYM